MGQSQRELRTRIKSVESTMHITRAMELVSSSKFKRAFDVLEKGKFYFQMLEEAFSEISFYAKESLFFKERETKKRTVIVISGDRGLVGSFNSSLYKIVEEINSKEIKTEVIPFGKKASEHYRADERALLMEGFGICDKITPDRIKELSESLAKKFVKGDL